MKIFVSRKFVLKLILIFKWHFHYLGSTCSFLRLNNLHQYAQSSKILGNWILTFWFTLFSHGSKSDYCILSHFQMVYLYKFQCKMNFTSIWFSRKSFILLQILDGHLTDSDCPLDCFSLYCYRFLCIKSCWKTFLECWRHWRIYIFELDVFHCNYNVHSWLRRLTSLHLDR